MNITYNVCKKCKRIIGVFKYNVKFLKQGISKEHAHNCPICKKKYGLKF